MNDTNPDYTSNWDYTRARSLYHFDPAVTDPRWDCIQGLGRFAGDWSQELQRAIDQARPVNWATRKFSQVQEVSPMLKQEEYDLEQAGADPKMTIFRLYDELDPVFNKMSDIIGLEEPKSRIHVQFPGEVLTQHIDKLDVYRDAAPEDIMRVVVMLTDWEPGHFYQYGNFTYKHWRAGDIHTFAWRHVPHCTANGSLVPRVSFQTTGIVTDRTREFMRQAQHQSAIEI